MTDVVAELRARQAILDGMYWYCSGLSRLDRELFARCFHPQATLQYPFFQGHWEDIADKLFAAFEHYSVRTMQMAQAYVSFGPEGTTATAESYVTATFWTAGEAPVDKVLPGHTQSVSASIGREVTQGRQDTAFARYTDRWSEVGGMWALDERRAVVDFYSITDAEGWVGDGRADREDPSYALEGLLVSRGR